MLPSFVLSFLGLELLLGLLALLGFGVWGVWGSGVFLWGSCFRPFPGVRRRLVSQLPALALCCAVSGRATARAEVLCLQGFRALLSGGWLRGAAHAGRSASFPCGLVLLL